MCHAVLAKHGLLRNAASYIYDCCMPAAKTLQAESVSLSHATSALAEGLPCQGQTFCQHGRLVYAQRLSLRCSAALLSALIHDESAMAGLPRSTSRLGTSETLSAACAKMSVSNANSGSSVYL